ncbi:MAG: hypothetical protein JRH06_14860 [Deltaproteobacteria bacterium]|nr:hypothetical protein [Deltaproteobacteria bacterium]
MMNCYMTNLPAIASGVKRYYKRIGKEANIVAFGGDGITSDAGFQTLSGAAERGENIIYICLDNEAYMNTGIQRSSTTPFGSWTTTTPVGKRSRGKERAPKYMPLLMAFHGHVLAPCPTGWCSPPDTMLELSRMAVETNYFPLWEAEYGHFRMTYLPRKARPLKEFTGLMGRFSHLTEEELGLLQGMVDRRLDQIMLQCEGRKQK